MPRPSRSILIRPSSWQIVLVPLHDRAVAHRRPLDRRDAHQRIARDHHAAGMDAHVARKVVDAPAEREEQLADLAETAMFAGPDVAGIAS